VRQVLPLPVTGREVMVRVHLHPDQLDAVLAAVRNTADAVGEGEFETWPPERVSALASALHRLVEARDRRTRRAPRGEVIAMPDDRTDAERQMDELEQALAEEPLRDAFNALER
jgi:hypothetical protein